MVTGEELRTAQYNPQTSSPHRNHAFYNNQIRQLNQRINSKRCRIVSKWSIKGFLDSTIILIVEGRASSSPHRLYSQRFQYKTNTTQQWTTRSDNQWMTHSQRECFLVQPKVNNLPYSVSSLNLMVLLREVDQSQLIMFAVISWIYRSIRPSPRK